MESNGYGSIFVGRGMSRAFQQAKDRENRTSDELVIAETKISRSGYLHVADVWKKRTSDRRTSGRVGNPLILLGLGVPVVQKGRTSGGSCGSGRSVK